MVLFDKDIKDIYQNFNKNTRHKIKKAMRFGVEVYKDTTLDVKDLYKFIKD